ncbi:MAG: class I SAM-dependent methyltransferase [Planctomycetota bacterium]
MLIALVVAGVVCESLLVWLVLGSGAAPAEWLPRAIGVWLAMAVVVLPLWALLREVRGRRATLVVVGFAMLFRITLLAVPPDALSEDIRRYVWDGRVTAAGTSPYAHTPADPALAHLNADGLAGRTNSASRFSVYPPLMQAIFAAAAWPGGSWTTTALLIRVAMVLCEFGTILLLLALLTRLGINRRHVLLYAWHPLPVFEFAVSGHTEAVMILLMLLTLHLLLAGRTRTAMLALSGAVLAKLLPLLLVPFVLRRHGWRHAWIIVLTCALAFVPFISSQVVQNVGSSLRLYFGAFEFNNGIYWLLAASQGLLTGPFGGDASAARLAQLGPVMFALSATWLVALFAFTWRRRDRVTLHAAFALVLGGYVCLSPVVHPWYLAMVLALIPLRRSAAWWWLCTAAGVSYVTYLANPPAENLHVVAVTWLGFAVLLALPVALGVLMRVLGRRKAAHVAAHVVGPGVLDLGAAEGFVGLALSHRGLQVQLCDVVDLNRTALPHVVYDGRTLPFADQSFDTVLIVLTLHHCADPDAVLAEAARVARQRVVITESVWTTPWNRRVLLVLDTLANRLRASDHIDAAINVRRPEEWEAAIARAGLRVTETHWLNRFVHQHLLLVGERAT